MTGAILQVHVDNAVAEEPKSGEILAISQTVAALRHARFRSVHQFTNFDQYVHDLALATDRLTQFIAWYTGCVRISV
jgi:hypothetical protein